MGVFDFDDEDEAAEQQGAGRRGLRLGGGAPRSKAASSSRCVAPETAAAGARRKKRGAKAPNDPPAVSRHKRQRAASPAPAARRASPSSAGSSASSSRATSRSARSSPGATPDVNVQVADWDTGESRAQVGWTGHARPGRVFPPSPHCPCPFLSSPVFFSHMVVQYKYSSIELLVLKSGVAGWRGGRRRRRQGATASNGLAVFLSLVFALRPWSHPF